jgi:branched-chain amino acid transport system substrate-binding protein
MRTDLKAWGIVIVILVVSTTFAGCLESNAPDDNNNNPTGNIKIGVLLPLTGGIASIAGAMQNAVNLARDDINAGGGINGKKLVIVPGDSKLDPTVGISELERVLGEGVQAVVGEVSSTITRSCAQEIQTKNKKVVLISPASTYTELTYPTRLYPYFFRDVPNDAIQGPKAAEAAKGKLGATKVVIMFEKNEYGIGLRDEFTKKFEALGGTILSKPSPDKYAFDVNAVDFSTQVLQAIAQSPDMIYIPGHYREISLIVKGLVTSGFTGKIMASEAYEAEDVFNIAGNAVNGVYFMKPTAEVARSNYTRFVTSYTAKYGTAPSAFCDFAYDAVLVIATAIGKVGNDGTKIKGYLDTHTFTNAITRDVQFDQYGDVKNADYTLYVTDAANREFKPVP